MVFTTAGGGASQLYSYEIDNSLRFNSGDSADLRFTPSSAGTEETFTISAWIKKSMVGTNNGQDCYLFSSQVDSNNRTVMGVFGSSGTQGIFFENKVSGTSSYVDSAATFRDPSAWMHCVWAIDTTQSTDTNRVKLYVNGSQISSFDSTSYLSQNTVTQWSRAQVNYIGSRAGGNYYDGYLSEVHVIDGQQLAPTEFGETNDNGVWIPKQYEGTYGTNGYKLEFQNSGALGTDTSANGNNFTATNLTATDQTTDTPTNNFCTMNPLIGAAVYTPPSYSEGNCQWSSSSSSSFGSSGIGSIPPSSGKWYWESKITSTIVNGVGSGARVMEGYYPEFNNDSFFAGSTSSSGGIGYSLNYNNGNPQTNSAEYNTGNATNAVSTNDIVGIAMDLDNGAIYYSINGTFQGTADPTSGASKTGAQHAFTPDGSYAPAVYGYSSSVFQMNFGNAPFTISSGNSDANGYGNFEYAVPSGYYALCTKNLAEYG